MNEHEFIGITYGLVCLLIALPIYIGHLILKKLKVKNISVRITEWLLSYNFVQKHKELIKNAFMILFALMLIVSFYYGRWWSILGSTILFQSMTLTSKEDSSWFWSFVYGFLIYGMFIVLVIAAYIWYYICGGWMVLEANSLIEIIGLFLGTLAAFVIVIGLIAMLFGWNPR